MERPKLPISEEEMEVANILQSDQAKDVQKLAEALAEAPYPWPSTDAIPILFRNLVEYFATPQASPQRRFFRINRAGKPGSKNTSFTSPMIRPGLDGIPLVIQDLRVHEFPPDELSTIFTGDLRLACKRKGRERNSLELWQDVAHQEKVVADARRFHGERSLKVSDLRQSHTWVASECTNFPLTVAAGVYLYFAPRAILDISAGWGDRAITAAAWREYSGLDVRYTGLDPNPDLVPRYQVLFQELNVGTAFELITTPAEDWEPGPNASYDLIFTSPPYFDLEEFAEGESASTQSITRYPNEVSWVQRFMIPALETAWRTLEVGGNLVLALEDALGKDHGSYYTEAVMLIIAARFPGARFRGVMGFMASDAKFARPLFCFEKLGYDSPNQIKAANNELQSNWKQYIRD